MASPAQLVVASLFRSLELTLNYIYFSAHSGELLPES